MTSYDPDKHHRRSVRLPTYDYTQPGAYFVTVCTYGRECLFGEVADGAMVLSESGRIVQEEWEQTHIVRPYVQLDAFVVMPNHLHGILIIMNVNTGTAAPCPYKKRDFGRPIMGVLPTIIRSLKSITSRRINELRKTPGFPVWQRNYYEHIIRNDHALENIRDYIVMNPMRWHLDQENPARRGIDEKDTFVWKP